MSDLVAIRDRARFSGPNSRVGFVQPTRLDDRFASATGKVLRVLAPAGYGKSSEVLRWVADDERKVRWLDLEPIDNDPLVLAHVIAGGLTDHPWSVLDIGTDDPVPFADLTRLISAPDEQFVLVLDDIHHLVSDEAVGLVDLIIDQLPPHSTLVLIGRAHHRVGSAARHRLEPGIVDVTAADLAIGHAAAANDVVLLENLVVDNYASYAARGMYRTLGRWLEHFSEQQILESLRLRQVRAVLGLGFGDPEQALGWTRLCRAEQITGQSTPAGADDVLDHQTDALHATLEILPASDLIPVARSAYRQLPHGEWRALASLALGANMYLCGQEGAVDVMREALFENEVARAITLQATAAASLAIVLDIEGSPDEAAELSARAVDLLATPLTGDAPAAAVSLAMASLVDARSGRHDEAAERRRAARIQLAKFHRCAPWFNILALVPLIRTSLLLDDAPMAIELWHELDRRMTPQDDGTPLAEHIGELGVEVRAADQAYAARKWALTAAELRVMYYLPTNLSLGDIAVRLYISRNTVKSHVAAIYRKLGAASRRAAVERARAAGLITDTPPTN